MKLQYRTMTIDQRRLAVANELRRLTELHGTISANKWADMRDRSGGLPGAETVAKLFNCARWAVFRERAIEYEKGDEVPGDTLLAATAHRDRRRSRRRPTQREIQKDAEVGAAVEEMRGKAAPRDWQGQKLALVASGEARPYRYYDTTRRAYVETVRYGGGRFDNR